MVSNILRRIGEFLTLIKLKRTKGLKTVGFPIIVNNGTFDIGQNVRLNSGTRANPIGGQVHLSFFITKNAILRIGNDTGISNTSIFVSNSVSIGSRVFIGGGCKIWDTDFHSLDFNIRNEDKSFRTGTNSPVVIHDDVFLGGFVTILKGVEIGKGSIIGAGSVVTKSIPENEIWAGNPAKFIKKNDV